MFGSHARDHQSRFLAFHERIKLKNTDENGILREKRDAVLRRMRQQGLTFEFFNQGSYSMGTGVVPVSADYDIDVGIVFSGQRPEDPLVVKKWVYDAVYGHTTSVVWMRHCIRVQYIKRGEPTYHVDLPVYWRHPWSMGLQLAVGKLNSSGTHKKWQDADPKGLVQRVNNHLSGEDRYQFKRVVRYLKRWKDVQFPVMGNAAPVGIGITVAALNWFRPSKAWNATTASHYNDLAAMQSLVDQMRAAFRSQWRDGESATRLVVTLPVNPRSDVFERMTNQQMKEFKQRLDTLSELLRASERSLSTDSLGYVLGADFW